MLTWIITGTGLALTSLVLLLGGLWHSFRLVCNNERRRLVADTARAVVAEVEARDARRARAARGTRQVPGGSRDTQQRSDEQREAVPRHSTGQASAEDEPETRESRHDVARGMEAAGMRDALRGLEQTISAEMGSLHVLVRNTEARIGQVEHGMRALAQLVHELGRAVSRDRPLARLPAPGRNHLSASRPARPTEQRRSYSQRGRSTVPADPSGQQHHRSYPSLSELLARGRVHDAAAQGRRMHLSSGSLFYENVVYTQARQRAAARERGEQTWTD
jgi:hypothetical protein